jgi:xylulokinase
VSSLFCGIDVGTTNLKVLLMDEAGETLWVKSVPAPHLNDGLGVVTDARALLARCEDLIIEGWRCVGQGRRLGAIASAGIGEDGVAIDADFNPLGHAIQWNDRRGQVHALALAAMDFAKAYPAILLDFSSSAGKWMWLKQNKPQELASAAAWITMTDWPIACWAKTAFMSATLAPRTGCYDVFTRQWLPHFLGYSSAPPLPHLVEAGEVVGTMTPGRLTEAGIADDATVLVAGGHDHPVAASTIRRMDRNARIDSMGTANATYGETTSLKAGDELNGLYVTLPISGASGAALIGMTEFSVTLGKTIDDVGAFYRAMERGERIPAHILPTLSGLAERTRDYWAAMTRVGVPEAPIFATGGWARCQAIIAHRAKVFGTPITVVDEPELVALGAALFAAHATGSNAGFSAAGRSHVVEPD